MILALTILFGGMTVVFLINVALSINFHEYTVLFSLLMVVINSVIIFLMDLIVSLTVRALPEKLYDATKPIYTVKKWERNFYEKIGIRKWKDKIPELGKITNFPKDKIDNTEPQYLFKFLSETCYAEVMHIFMTLVGFVIIAINPIKYVWNFTLPLALVNMILNVMPICVQRYNRPKLLALYKFKSRNVDKNGVDK